MCVCVCVCVCLCVWFVFVGFYGISTTVGYLMSNYVYTYTCNINYTSILNI